MKNIKKVRIEYSIVFSTKKSKKKHVEKPRAEDVYQTKIFTKIVHGFQLVQKVLGRKNTSPYVY